MKQLINDGWSFVKLPSGSTPEQAFKAEWQAVDLPHDWLIGQAHDLYETADAWYRRVLPRSVCSAPVCLVHFDGVYMDCDVLLNGEIITSHAYGYTAFYADLTGRLRDGDNELAVHIRHRSPNSRWYSGSGIFRDVHLVTLPQKHLIPDSLYVITNETDTGWELRVSAETAGAGTFTAVLADENGAVTGKASAEAENGKALAVLHASSVRRWSVADPYLYTLTVTFGEQTEQLHVGFRTLRFDPAGGFFLNGEHTKLKGVCLHHDLGCLGAAFHPKAAARQLRVMKEMGVNALRTSHNPPASALLDLCDREGILVIDEAFDMWERSKTEFDYARFFPAHEAEDVALWIRRDRCHPCVIMWSVGNEIYDMHADERGRQVMLMLARQVREHDPDGHAEVTFGSNYMPWEGAQRCAEDIRIPGYNYGEKYYDAHHAKHPDWVIYGSETGSMLFSRGIYHFPKSKSILSDVDLQCSSLGNSTSSWGAKDPCGLICDDLHNPYSMGQFLWSGIDYIGEPTPYQTRSCYFGLADTACFPKDMYYLFQSQWTDRPMIHIGVHWDWNIGQMIDVNVMTNGAEAELLLNGESLGRKQVIRGNTEKCMPCWRVPFRPGVLTARAYDRNGSLLREESRFTPGDGKQLRLSAEDGSILSDGHDITFITVTIEDENGHPVENARNRINIRVSGGGRLLGTDNGDPSDTEEYKSASRRLFGGKLLLIVGSDGTDENISIEAESPGREGARLEIPVRPAPRVPGVSCLQKIPETAGNEICLRRIGLIPEGSTELTPDHPECAFGWQLFPADAAPRPIRWQVTNESGIETPSAVLRVTEDRVFVTGRGDGVFLLRALSGNADDHPELISQLEFTAHGFGSAAFDPYSFVSAGLYDLSDGEIGSGNEQGIAFARDGYSMAGFSRVDFGKAGSGTVTMPVFALDGEEHEITVWLDDPRQNGVRPFTVLKYKKPSIWNVYQEETWELPEVLTGMHTLCFSMTDKVHLKGFRFERMSRAFRPQTAADADGVWGDAFRKEGDRILGIGNNVTLVWNEMDFGNAGEAELVLRGNTPLETNAVTIRMENDRGENLTELAMFRGDAGTEQSFPIRVPGGMCSVSLVFLPGSCFDLYGFVFRKPAPSTP
ncbi:MAG: glycoside hydrolase family 2 TIM barrel-domain containing protein [Clostridia bacterium]|nr:glycoside hydrolase family 2 TIM barrel-domain containing protein [Clostridia bacterium]